MVQTFFEILPEGIFFLETNLICEVSRDGFSCIFQNDADKKISGVLIFYFEKNDPQIISEALNNIFSSQPLLHKKYKRNIISWSDAESILLPAELYKPGENENLINTIYGDLNAGVILNDQIISKKIYNIYRIPLVIRQALIDQFPTTIFNHQYTYLIKQISAESNLLTVIFYRTKFVIMLVKDGELQIIQTYSYRTNDDVVYYLHKIIEQFKADDLPLQLSGMIEKSSELVNRISFYFKNISFDEISQQQQFQGKGKELPSHYYAHLLSVSSCV